MKRYIILISILIFSCYLYGCKGEFLGPGINDFAYNLPGSYMLYHAGETNIYKDDITVIERNVAGIAWDESFILAEQLKDKKLSYWIIDVKEKKTYGGFNKDDFEIKKIELKVNTKLKLENPEKYKSLERHLVQ